MKTLELYGKFRGVMRLLILNGLLLSSLIIVSTCSRGTS
jgi:hypothetical protein